MMAQHADGKLIPAYLNDRFFKSALQHGLRAPNIELVDICIKDMTRGGENYCSNIFRAYIHYRHNDVAVQPIKTDATPLKSISVIVKSMPKAKQGVLEQLNIYMRETVFYLDIKPKLETLMWYRNNWILAAPHLLSSTEPEEFILFDDLCSQGFVLKCRQAGLDRSHAELVMQKLGEYHALTMLLAEKEPHLLSHYTYGLVNEQSVRSPPFKVLFGAQLLKLAELLADTAELSVVAKKLQRYHNRFVECVLRSIRPLRGQVNVLNHGDLWVNNIFFRYDQDKRPMETRFIDFQLCYYASPGFDVNYFLNTSVQLKVLRQHRQILIEHYCDSFLSTLAQLPYGDTMPSRKDLMLEISQHEAYGLFVAFAFFPLMSMISLDSQDNSLEKLQDQAFAQHKIQLMFESNPRTLDSLKHIVSRADELGVLDALIHFEDNCN